MTFKESPYYSDEANIKELQLPFGTFYLTDKYVVAEVNSGVTVDWKKITALFDEIEKHYPEGHEVGYISNRINRYYSDPGYWSQLNLEYDFIVAIAIVSYDSLGYHNASMEKSVVTRSLKRCTSLEEAIDFILNLEELKY